ncbi:MAG: DUF308 domain-containing protein [Thermoplasmata archaeon]|nr:DUF308 domain-containing protein [Thermoplasmata archaeon]
MIIILGILVLVYPGLGFSLILILFGIGLVFVALFAIVLGAQSDYPGWLRALSLIIGVLVIVLVILIIVFPEFGLFLQTLFLGLGLILLGIQGVAFTGTDKSAAGWVRGLAVVLGVIAIILGILMIAIQDVGQAVLLIYFAVGLFVTGIAVTVNGAAG